MVPRGAMSPSPPPRPARVDEEVLTARVDHEPAAEVRVKEDIKQGWGKQ